MRQAVTQCPHDRLFILTDTHTRDYCLPLIESMEAVDGHELITIAPGDEHKNLETLAEVWSQLSHRGGTRHSLLLNLGGGMVTDLGGFAASTFKRGITYINIPTTLLAMVDAAVGGKTGINFNGLKNEVGVFVPARFVLIDTEFLKSLDAENLRSGYAEMLKHGLISTEAHWADLVNFDMDRVDYKALQALVARSVAVKEQIVGQDPYERGIRKALNFGHTVGHAYESLSFREERPIPHGHAVAAGIVSELYLSHRSCGFPKEKLSQVVRYIKEYYAPFPFDCGDYGTLYELMTHDKKNEGGVIRFTLLGDVGDVRINQSVPKDAILESLDFYRENFGV